MERITPTQVCAKPFPAPRRVGIVIALSQTRRPGVRKTKSSTQNPRANRR